MRAHLRAYLNKLRPAGIPLYVGEFGMADGAVDRDQWIRETVGLFDEFRLGRGWWEYWTTANHGAFSATSSSGHWRPFADLLVSSRKPAKAPTRTPPPAGAACGRAEGPGAVGSHRLDRVREQEVLAVGERLEGTPGVDAGNCSRSDSGQYAVRHNPAAYYAKIAARCKTQDVPLGATPDISARFTFVTPNCCHDMHSSSCGSGAATEIRNGDRWLAGFLPKVLSSAPYRAGRTAVFITWDEDDSGGTQHVPTLVIAPSVPPRTAVSTKFDHYSLLRTTEEMLGLPTIANATAAASMRSSFNLG